METHLETNIGNADAAQPEKFLGLLNSALNQVLARRGVKGIAERTQEMITGQASLFGDLCQVERLIVTFVHVTAGAPKAFAEVRICRRDGFVTIVFVQSVAGFYCESEKSGRLRVALP